MTKGDSSGRRPVIQDHLSVADDLGAQFYFGRCVDLLRARHPCCSAPEWTQAIRSSPCSGWHFPDLQNGRAVAGSSRRIRKWSPVCRQFRRWTMAGLWQDILDALNPAGVAPDKPQMVDSTVIRAHHHAAGVKGGLRKRLLAVREIDSRSRPPTSRSGTCCFAPERFWSDYGRSW